MLYAALAFFGASVLMLYLDFTGIRFAHGAGPAATLLALMGLTVLAAKIVADYRHQGPRPHH